MRTHSSKSSRCVCGSLCSMLCACFLLYPPFLFRKTEMLLTFPSHNSGCSMAMFQQLHEPFPASAKRGLLERICACCRREKIERERRERDAECLFPPRLRLKIEVPARGVKEMLRALYCIGNPVQRVSNTSHQFHSSVAPRNSARKGVASDGNAQTQACCLGN